MSEGQHFYVYFILGMTTCIGIMLCQQIVTQRLVMPVGLAMVCAGWTVCVGFATAIVLVKGGLR